MMAQNDRVVVGIVGNCDHLLFALIDDVGFE